MSDEEIEGYGRMVCPMILHGNPREYYKYVYPGRFLSPKRRLQIGNVSVFRKKEVAQKE